MAQQSHGAPAPLQSYGAHPAPFQSNFAILDVKATLGVKDGRHTLARQITAGGKVRVCVDLILDSQHSADDGVSIEFSGHVVSTQVVGV